MNYSHAEAAVVALLQSMGEDPGRDGLIDTPRRVVKALSEMTSGNLIDPVSYLTTTFDVGHYDEMIVVRRIPFASLCEHHMLPFTGHATVGYIPQGRVVGLSKFARVVLAYARRLQVQERLTAQIADCMVDGLAPLGCGVIIEGEHSCMANRGVERAAPMITSATRGIFRSDPSARQEFLTLVAQH